MRKFAYKAGVKLMAASADGITFLKDSVSSEHHRYDAYDHLLTPLANDSLVHSKMAYR